MADTLLRFGWLVALLLASGCAARPVIPSSDGRVSAAEVQHGREDLPQPPAECVLKSGYEPDIEIAPAADTRPVVPIVIFLMKNDNCGSDCAAEKCWSNSPGCWWTPKRVRELFSRGSGVNHILERAVRVAVERVFECQYRPQQFGQGSDERYMPTPEPCAPEWEALSTRIHQHFGLARRLNLFVWLRIGDINEMVVTYYGTSPLRRPALPGRSVGAVWADASCGEGEAAMPPEKCTRMLAHEIGHALGLVHVKRDATATPVLDTVPECRDGREVHVEPIRSNARECRDGRGVDLKRNLMVPEGTANDVELTEAQVCQMVNVANEYSR